MNKIIKKYEKEGIVQITVFDERWYQKGDTFVPSVTWIAGHYPKGTQFYKWLAQKGWDEAEAIKSAAGDKGSKVHYAIEDLLQGKEITMESEYINPSTEQKEKLTLKEYECLLSFRDWFNLVQPKNIKSEFVIFNDKIGYAGTVDITCEIGGETYLIDFKTGQSLWPEHDLQLSAYNEVVKAKKMAILQLGYARNKNKWKFTELENKFPLFLAAKQIWANENAGVEPKKYEWPEKITLTVRVPVTGTINSKTEKVVYKRKIKQKYERNKTVQQLRTTRKVSPRRSIEANGKAV